MKTTMARKHPPAGGGNLLLPVQPEPPAGPDRDPARKCSSAAARAAAAVLPPDPRLEDEALGADIEVDCALGARLLGISERTLRRYCDEGVFKEGAHWRRHKSYSPYIFRRRALVAKKLGWL